MICLKPQSPRHLGKAPKAHSALAPGLRRSILQRKRLSPKQVSSIVELVGEGNSAARGLLLKLFSFSPKCSAQDILHLKDFARDYGKPRSNFATKALIVLAHNGSQAAKNSLMEAHFPYALHLTRSWPSRKSELKAHFARTALANTIRDFDLRKKTKFGTYLYWHIRKQKQLYAKESYADVRKSHYMKKKLEELSDFASGFKARHGREPTPEELSKMTGKSIETIRRLENIPKSEKMVPLDAPLKKGLFREIRDLAPSPHELVEARERREILRREVKWLHSHGGARGLRLDAQEFEVFAKRYLYDGLKQPAQEIVGRSMNPPVSKARVSKIEISALRKLRTHMAGKYGKK